MQCEQVMFADGEMPPKVFTRKREERETAR
jgi:hypothetical protein